MKQPISPVGQSMRMLLIQLVRELLFNVVKHAGVKQAAIAVFEDGGRLHIQIKDEGLGFNPADLNAEDQNGGHLGLFSVRERLRLFGGRLDIESQPGAGACMTIVAPLLEATESP